MLHLQIDERGQFWLPVFVILSHEKFKSTISFTTQNNIMHYEVVVVVLRPRMCDIEYGVCNFTCICSHCRKACRNIQT